jgi:hypothetical protein
MRSVFFSSWPPKIAAEIAESIDTIKLRLSGGFPPHKLQHYTDFDGVVGIGTSRALRATCVADLGNRDQAEISYGAQLVSDEVKRRLERHLGFLSQAVLERLATTLVSRRAWTFVACFCPIIGSPDHQGYGRYSLEFDTSGNWKPNLRPRHPSADVQYLRVTYGLPDQRLAVKQSISSIVTAIEKNSQGRLRGGGADSIVKSCALDASQLLMDIVASFKQDDFRKEQEWRIVCRPGLSLASSDRVRADEDFRALICGGRGKRHVELRAGSSGSGLGTPTVPQIPFRVIRRADRFQTEDDEKLRIVEMLESNDRLDIELG